MKSFFSYFERIHPHFPVMDKESFFNMYRTDSSGLADSLICSIYASSLVYWHASQSLAVYSRPDVQFVRSLANAALQEEWLSPQLSTITSCLIELNARPVLSAIQNNMKIGQLIALAHSLGLNRDPTMWGIPQEKQYSRVRLWWGILIHDRW
jgi:hypothetical protein